MEVEESVGDESGTVLSSFMTRCPSFGLALEMQWRPVWIGAAARIIRKRFQPLRLFFCCVLNDFDCFSLTVFQSTVFQLMFFH